MKKLFFYLFLILKCQAQNCQYVAYENFSGDTGSSINQMQNGFGWSEPWIVQNMNNEGFKINNADLPSYSAFGSALTTTDNYLEAGHNYLLLGRRLNTSPNGPFKNLVSNNSVGKANTELYFSALIKTNSSSNNNMYIGLHNENIAYYSGTSDYLQIGYFDNFTDPNQRFWSLNFNGTIIRSLKPFSSNQTIFVVVKMSWNQQNSCNIQVSFNPSEIGTTNDPSFDLNTSGSFSFKNFNLFANAESNFFAVDELRFALSYRCVSPHTGIIIDPPPLPPNAVITSNTADGDAPFTLNFDSQNSSDPDGTIVSRYWLVNHEVYEKFDTIRSISGSKTYNRRGSKSIKLVVIDNEGNESSKEISFNIRNNLQPCNSYIDSIIAPNCDASRKGRISFYALNGETVSIRNSANQVFVANGRSFVNLEMDTYYFSKTLVNECADTDTLVLKIDSTTCASYQKDICSMKMGMGIGSVNDFSSSRPFKDHFKMTRDEVYTFTDTSSKLTQDQFRDLIQLDTNGYALKIPFYKSNNHAFKIAYVLSASGSIKQGNYQLKYEGNGILDVVGVTNKVFNPSQKTVTFQVNTNDVIYLRIDSSQFGNHLRDITILALKDTLGYVSQPFNEDFLNHLNQFSTIRFMDWQETNNNIWLKTWSDRKKATYFTQASYNESSFGRKGVAYEYLIELANLLKKDVWICIPHAVDSTYIAKMANLFKTKLDPSIGVYLEYSNEVWNSAGPFFRQYQYVDNAGEAYLNHAQNYARLAKKSFEIWMKQWQDQPSRIKRVIGVWAAIGSFASEIAGYLPSNSYDYLSPSFYFGHSAVNAFNHNNPNDILDQALHDFRNTEGPQIKFHYKLAKLYNKDIVHYEGGQHLLKGGNTGTAVYDAQILPKMSDIYNEVIDSVRRWGAKLAVQYILYGSRVSSSGSWGLLENDSQDILLSPKYLSVVKNTCRTENCAKTSIIQKDITANLNTVWSSKAIEMNGTVHAISNSIFTSEKYIELKPGFETKLGTVFKVNLGSCP